ncbi:MAG: hypothetical protein SNJ78_02245 [Spirochaetales bacterium]
MKRLLCLVLVFLHLGLSIESQSSKDPVPYAPEEFPSWARALRRGEIIALGLFPFVFLFSSLSYSTFRFASSGGDPRYAPGPFQSPGAPPLSQTEKGGVLLVSVSISFLLAFVDFLIESRKSRE